MTANSSEEPSREARLEQIIADYLRALDAGTAPDREGLFQRHADLAEGLRDFFVDHDMAVRLAMPPAAQTEAVTLAPASPAVGTHVRYFGDYELLEEIARGGMGVVFKARQVSVNLLVAVKMILSGQFASPIDIQRFYTEAEAAANLDHPNIVPIYEVGEHQGQQYFSMKLIEGGSLAQSPPSTVRERVQVMVRVARALHYAHQRGILHRDLKPANVLLDTAGIPYVTDFGLAKHVQGKDNLTASGAIVGTPGYMPPEQASGKKGLTLACDVYALGAVLYELLTGRPPFQGETPLDTILQVLDREPQSPRALNPRVDADLAAICLKCLSKEPAARYDSAVGLADELEHWLSGEPLSVRPRSAAVVVWWWLRKNLRSAAWVSGVGAGCGTLMGLLFFLHQIHWRGNLAYQQFSSVRPPWPLSLGPERSAMGAESASFLIQDTVLSLLSLVPLLMAGLLVALAVRPRDRWADLSAGGLMALIGATVFFFLGAGPTITAQQESHAIAEDVRLLALGFTRHEPPPAVERQAGTPPKHPQEVLLERYPDLESVTEDRRAGYLTSKIVADLWPAAVQGIWLGLFVSGLFFVPTGLVQTSVAGHLMRGGTTVRHILSPYLEVGILAFLWSCLLVLIFALSIAT